MRGDMAIRELRRMGKKPLQAWVFLLEPGQKPPGFVDPEDLLASGQFPEVHVGPEEPIHALDFRCLTGVTVHLQGGDPARLRAVYVELIRCEPLRVIVSGGEVFHDTGAETCTTT